MAHKTVVTEETAMDES